MVEVILVDAHGAARDAVFAEGDAGLHGLLGERAVVVVVVELVALRVVGDGEVRPAVHVVVNHRHAQRFAGGIVDAGLLGDVFEAAVAEVMKEPGSVALVSFRRAIGFVAAVERAIEVVLLGPLHVVGHE